jgi:SAM-dependent methyltransferase
MKDMQKHLMNCRICSKKIRPSYVLHSGRFPIDVQTYYCEECEAFFSSGGEVNYENADLINYYLSYEKYIRSRYQTFFSFIDSVIAPKRFLDIGAGMGFSLVVANQFGWLSKGMEPNKVLADYAISVNCDVYNCYLDGEMFGEYDMILIDNVLEHISQPNDFLEHAKHLLAPSGMLVIAVPPLDWLRKGLAKVSYIRNHIAAPQLNIFNEVDEHVNIFSRKAMGHLLQKVGLRLLDTRFHHSPIYNNKLYRGLGLDDGYYFAVHV